MFINKWIQEMAKRIAWDKILRPALAWVKFWNNKAVATDSFKLMEVTFSKDKMELPELKKFKQIQNDENITIHTDDINALKVPKTKTKQFNVIQIWNINDEVDWKTKVSLWTYDWKRENVINTRWIQSPFPDYENFFNTNIDFKVWMNIDHLLGLLNTYKAMWIMNIIFEFDSKDNLKPINIINKNNLDWEIEQVKSILMPLRID